MDTMFADRPVADETLNQSAKATSQDPLPVVLKAALAHVERADKAEKNAADHQENRVRGAKPLREHSQYDRNHQECQDQFNRVEHASVS